MRKRIEWCPEMDEPTREDDFTATAPAPKPFQEVINEGIRQSLNAERRAYLIASSEASAFRAEIAAAQNAADRLAASIARVHCAAFAVRITGWALLFVGIGVVAGILFPLVGGG